MARITSQVDGKAVILSEAPGYRSREVVTVSVAGTAIPAGQVLGKLTSGGKYVPYDPQSEDGNEEAVAILLLPTDAITGDAKCTVIVRDAEVNRAELVGLDADAQAALLALGIVVRGTSGLAHVSTPSLA